MLNTGLMQSGLMRGIFKRSYFVYAKIVTLFLGLLETCGFYDFPHIIRIESTNKCNANCTICTRESLTRKLSIMDIDLFKKIVDECEENKVKTLHLHNFGEPLLDPLLGDRITYAKKAGMKLRIFSNFSVLNEKIARMLIDTGIDEIKISIDGNSKETYESIRKNLKFDKVVANVEMMLRMRKEMNSQHPRLSVVFVATDENKHEVPAFKKRWEGKVDKVLISSFHNWAGGLDKGEESFKERLMPCFRIWRTFTIMCDGRVALCCLDYNGKVVLGDVNKQTIKEIYHGPKLKKIQRQHLTWNYDKTEMCLNCEGRR